MSFKDLSLKPEELKSEATDTPAYDPWELSDLKPTGKPWKEKTRKEKVRSTLVVSLKLVLLFGLLYLFICSLDFLSNAFRLLGGKAAGETFSNNDIMSNPVACVVAGILVTVLVQSSSTSTSIVVSMVSSELLQVQPAVFIIMGTNIGTSVTNTLVAMGQSSNRDEFRRAFAGATIHDMFNWLSVFCLLPVEWISSSLGSWKGCGFLCQITHACVQNLETQGGAGADQDLIKVITKPFTELFVQIDSSVLSKIATGEVQGGDVSLLKTHCNVPEGLIVDDHALTCHYMFERAVVVNGWSDIKVGVCLLVLALATLCMCLALIVKLLHSLLKGQITMILKKVVNSKFPSPFGFLTGYVAILVGAGITVLLQSSSIFTSALTPLVGIGVLHLKRMYPLTLGANIGTTFTAIMAAMASSRDKLSITMQVALCHLFFNIFGILIWYPVPKARKVPIRLAQGLGNTTAKYRWFAIFYLIAMFGIVPAAVFGLSIAGWRALLGVGLPILLLVIAVLIINSLQKRKPSLLPFILRSWDFLPLFMHSLQPYDELFSKMCFCFRKEKRKGCGSSSADTDADYRRDVSSDATLELIAVESQPSEPTSPVLGVQSAGSAVRLLDMNDIRNPNNPASVDMDIDVDLARRTKV